MHSGAVHSATEPMRAAVRASVVALLLCLAPALFAEWKTLAPGAAYATFSPDPPIVYHVTRIDLRSDDVELFVTGESERGARVTDVAARHDALVAVNGDYFDEKLRPTGVTLGACGRWDSRAAPTKRRAALVAIGSDKAAIVESATPPKWARNALSGWPVLVRGCHALTARQLPGSDRFTRAPHYRTAVGVDSGGTTIYIVAATGRKGESAGVTLAALGSFMRETLGVCSAVNLDGGGSTVMTVGGTLVAQPSYGEERRVANHLVVVRSEDYPACDAQPMTSSSVRATDRQIQEDIAEVLGRKGHVESGGIYRVALGRFGVNRDSWVAFRRDGDAVVMSGLVAVPSARAREVETMLRRDTIDIVAVAPASAGISTVRFGGTGAPARLAGALRTVIDALQQ